MLERIAACAVMALGLVATAQAADAPAAVPTYVQESVPGAVAAGSARLRWYGLHIYDARLYVGTGFSAATFKSQPFALELTYARSLDGSKIAERSRDEIAALGIGTEGERANWLQTMTKLFPDVKDGTRLTGINLPGVGAAFYMDGKLLGRIDDPAFAQAFFSIWLDPKTSQPEMRASLLKPGAG